MWMLEMFGNMRALARQAQSDLDLADFGVGKREAAPEIFHPAKLLDIEIKKKDKVLKLWWMTLQVLSTKGSKDKSSRQPMISQWEQSVSSPFCWHYPESFGCWRNR